ncbi:MAG: hypothetical protein Q9205_007811 [Flavoplaca limonia]
MRPLISTDLSTLINHLPFSRSRRTPSPFTDEEANSNGLASLGKVSNEKPYNEPCANPAQQGQKYRHISQCQTDPPQPILGRGQSGVQTHRSRIESYTPEMFDYITLEKPKPSPNKKAKLASEKRRGPKKSEAENQSNNNSNTPLIRSALPQTKAIIHRPQSSIFKKSTTPINEPTSTQLKTIIHNPQSPYLKSTSPLNESTTPKTKAIFHS